MTYEKKQVFESKCRRCGTLNLFDLNDKSTIDKFVSLYKASAIWHDCEFCDAKTFQDLTFCGYKVEYDQMPRLPQGRL